MKLFSSQLKITPLILLEKDFFEFEAFDGIVVSDENGWGF